MNLYDFDKTIFNGDCSVKFYFYCLKKQPGIIKYLPIQIINFILFNLKLIKKEKFKSQFFSFLKSIENIDETVQAFWNINEQNIFLWYLKQKKSKDVIISASPEFLLQPIMEKLGITNFAATPMNKKTGIITGNNCYGIEKISAIEKLKITGNFINAYSDSISDEPMLNLAKNKYYIKRGNVLPYEYINFSFKDKIRKKFKSKQFLAFLLVGMVNAINGIIFAALFSLFINPEEGFILGYIVSLSISYLLNSKFTFSNQRLSIKKYSKFLVSYIPNFVIQYIVVLFALNLFQLDKIIAFFISAIIGVPITFLLLSNFAFKQGDA